MAQRIENLKFENLEKSKIEKRSNLILKDFLRFF